MGGVIAAIIAGVGLVIAGIVLWAVLFALGALAYTGLVALVWNVLADEAFGVDTLNFLQALTVGAALTVISGIFNRPSVRVGKEV